MPGCKFLTLKTEDNPENPEDPEVYWWCSKLEKYANHRDCTIIPCTGVAMGGCEVADYSDYWKKYGFEMRR